MACHFVIISVTQLFALFIVTRIRDSSSRQTENGNVTASGATSSFFGARAQVKLLCKARTIPSLSKCPSSLFRAPAFY